MKSLADLEAIQQSALEEISMKKITNGKRVVVGMATCGIAAGARPVMDAFVEQIKTKNINNVSLTMVGCIGVCRLEPMVEVIEQDGNKTTYVNVTPEKVVRIIDEHIINGKVCKELSVADNS
jgi:NADP-reducing hydrogenase subunit HndB